MTDVITAPTQIITAHVSEELQFTFDPTILDLPNTGDHAPTAYFVQLNLDTSLPDSRLEAAIPDAEPAVTIGSVHLDEKSLLFAFTNSAVTAKKSIHYKIKIKIGENIIESQDPEMQIPPPNG